MRVTTIWLAALCLGLAAPAIADTLHFKARLSGAGEAPPTTGPGKGDLVAVLDTDSKVLAYKVTYKGLSGPATGASFDGPAKTGQIAPPVFTMDDPSSPISGHASLTDAQVAQLEKGLWYFNVATQSDPDGEIRGQVKHDFGLDEDSQRGPPMGWRDVPRMPAQIGNR